MIEDHPPCNLVPSAPCVVAEGDGVTPGLTILAQARETLRLEAEEILAAAGRLDARFERCVDILHGCQGRVVVTGMGKSGLIGKKIAATLASTGTPAFFLHPAEGSHGDVGMLTNRDVVLVLSNSGDTWEVVALLPVIKRLGIPLVALVGRADAILARESDCFLDVSVRREACPLNLAPTSSTTVALAMGDAVAVALLQKRGFGPEQFAERHPGGALGKRLLLRVADLMHQGERIPLVDDRSTVRDALFEMTTKRFGMTGVRDGQGELCGIITDGDVRRWLERDAQLLQRRAAEIMTPQPRFIGSGALAVEAVKIMEENKITSLFVRDGSAGLVGVIHLHDLLQAGLM
ncbi:MAG: KpsF/GutQ family sugar-phosphate isomerase [Magnetococcales bacterium]|nr:KpsF/GutQ family sugar-phosphate isomerase [Magnetococcales bacterium]